MTALAKKINRDRKASSPGIFIKNIRSKKTPALRRVGAFFENRVYADIPFFANPLSLVAASCF